MTLEQAREAIQKEYPKQEIGLGFEYEGAWYFRVGGGDNGGIHAVDDKTGFVTGCLPTLLLLDDEKFAEALRKASGVKKNELTPYGGDEIEHCDLRIWRKSEFLAHHGIMGQKWGVRRFQNLDGSLTSEGKIRYSKTQNSADKEGMSPMAIWATTRIAATAVAITSVATVMAIESHNEKMGDTLLDKKKIADTNKQFSDGNLPKKIVGEHTAEDDMKKVNEAYGGLRPQTQNNCVHCSATMELRRRGFDVCARTSSEPVYTQDVLDKCFKPKPKNQVVGWDVPDNYSKMTAAEKTEAYRKANAENRYASNFQAVEKNMLKYCPEGSRGLFSAVCPYSNIGHAMAFEVKKGKVIVYDTQSNVKFDLAKPPSGYERNFAPVSTSFYRLDDKEINWDGVNIISAERTRK